VPNSHTGRQSSYRAAACGDDSAIHDIVESQLLSLPTKRASRDNAAEHAKPRTGVIAYSGNRGVPVEMIVNNILRFFFFVAPCSTRSSTRHHSGAFLTSSNIKFC